MHIYKPAKEKISDSVRFIEFGVFNTSWWNVKLCLGTQPDTSWNDNITIVEDFYATIINKRFLWLNQNKVLYF